MKKLQVWLPLLFSIVLIVRMWIGSGLRKNIPFSCGLFESARPSTVQEVMDPINLRYVDSVHPDSLSDDAVMAMLGHLDPHSIYIPANRLAEVNEDLQGNFEGIGVEYFILSDTVYASNVLANGPSDKAGIKTGDRFLKVGDSVVTGKDINGDKIRKLLRGPSGSKVTITLLRDGKQLTATVTRGTIPSTLLTRSLYAGLHYRLYEHVNNFSGTTYEEFMAAMEDLQQKGLKKLMLDLRDNGGGILGKSHRHGG